MNFLSENHCYMVIASCKMLTSLHETFTTISTILLNGSRYDVFFFCFVFFCFFCVCVLGGGGVGGWGCGGVLLLFFLSLFSTNMYIVDAHQCLMYDIH